MRGTFASDTTVHYNKIFIITKLEKEILSQQIGMYSEASILITFLYLGLIF
jgi:hypothetical protein